MHRSRRRSGPWTYTALAVAGLALAFSLLAARADAYIYWDQGGSIARASHQDAGASSPHFISGFTSLAGIAVDGAHVYWSDQNSNRIGRANLDGTGVEQNFITGANMPTRSRWTALTSTGRTAARAATTRTRSAVPI